MQYGMKVTVALRMDLFSYEEKVILYIFCFFLSELASDRVENHSQSWGKKETQWILATCIYSYFFPRNGWKSKTEAVVSHFSVSWTTTFPVTAAPRSGPSCTLQ